MLRFKVDPLVMLKEKGLNSNRLRKDAIFGGATIQKLRHRKICSMNEFERLCKLLNLQPGDLLEYVEDVPGEGVQDG